MNAARARLAIIGFAFLAMHAFAWSQPSPPSKTRKEHCAELGYDFPDFGSSLLPKIVTNRTGSGFSVTEGCGFPSPHIYRVPFPHHSWEIVAPELLDTNQFWTIGRSVGLNSADLETVQIMRLPGLEKVRLCQTGETENVFNVLSNAVTSYVRERAVGHTNHFWLATLTNRPNSGVSVDPHLSMLLKEHPLFSGTSFEKVGSGVFTNEPRFGDDKGTLMKDVHGKIETSPMPAIKTQVFSWVDYRLIDGEVAWQYRVTLSKAESTYCNILRERIDAKEFDPKLRGIIETVTKEINQEINPDGKRKRGLWKAFERMKKEKLESHGIEWHTPSELNPEWSERIMRRD